MIREALRERARYLAAVATGKRLERVLHWLSIAALLLFVVGLSPEGRRAVVFLPQVTVSDEAKATAQGSLELWISALDGPLPEACKAPHTSPAATPSPAVLPECTGDPLRGAIARAYLKSDGSYLPVASSVSDDEGKSQLEGLPLGDYWILVDAPLKARRSLTLTVTEGTKSVRLLLEPAAHVTVRVVDEGGRPIGDATVLAYTSDPLPFGALTDGAGKTRLDRLGPAPWRITVSARGYESEAQSDVNADLQVTLKRQSGLLVRVVDGEGNGVSNATVLIVGASLWPARRTTTNAEGSARISGLGAGAYDLRAQAGDRISSSRFGVVLSKSEQQEVTLRLLPGRYVTVFVVSGEAEPAEAVANADVTLVENGISPFPWQGRTGDDGQVTLGPIPAGDAMVSAHAEGFIGRAAVSVPSDLDGPLRVALRRGGTVVGEVLDRNGHAIDGASLEVVGTDLDGLPIAETPFSVALRRSHFEAALPAPQPLVAAGDLGVMPGGIPGIPGAAPVARESVGFVLPVLSDAWVSGVEGAFKLHPVTPGRIRVLARHPTYIEAESAVLTLEAGGEINVKIVMLEGASLQGRVLDDAGLPVANARVELSSVLGSTKSSTFTASDGSFAFAAVPGEILLSLARPEAPSQFVVRKTLHLKNEERREIELVLPKAREAVTLTISGEREPVEFAQVLVISLDPEVPLRQTLFSDAKGQVTLADAAGLPLRIQIDAPGFGKYQKSFESAATEIALELMPGILVEGTVTVVRGRQSLEGAQVTAFAEGQRQSTRTDARGAYRFSDLNPGQVTLVVSHPEYATVERVVELTSTGRSDRAFDVDPIDLIDAGKVSGSVYDNAGNPVAGARVSIGVVPASLPAGDLPRGIVLTNGRGEFELGNLEPGRVSISAYAVDVGRGTAEGIEIKSGEVTSDVRILLTRASPDTESDTRAGIAVTLAETNAADIQKIIIVQVAAGSEAERADLKVGDVILKIDGEPVSSLADARARLGGFENSDVLIEVQRADASLKLRVRRQQLRQ